MAVVETVAERVRAVIVEQLGVDAHEVTPTASFAGDLGADSLDSIEIVMALEEEFSIEIPDADVDVNATFGDVVAYVERRVANA